jgi:hypothetical protein
MAKKIVRVEVVAEQEVDTEWYEDNTDDGIIEAEAENWQEWIVDNVVSEEVTIRDVDE